MKKILAFTAFAVLLGIVVGVVWLFINGPPALSALFAGIAGFLASRLYEAWSEGKARLYDKKREIYAKLSGPYQKLLLATINKADQIKQDEIIQNAGPDMAEAVFDTILYGSDDVIRQYSMLRYSDPQGGGGYSVLVHFSRLLIAMRRDLGNMFTSVNEEEILSVFVNFDDEEREKLRLFLNQQ